MQQGKLKPNDNKTNKPDSFQINKLSEGRRNELTQVNLNSMVWPYTLTIKERTTLQTILNAVCCSGMGDNSDSLAYI